jgi:Plasmid stabilization system protein
MAKYRFTNKAVEDLTDIWNYTFDVWSEIQADLYYEILINSCLEIAKNPNLGKNYEEIAKYLFGYRTNKHVIFYRIISSEEIEVVRILHGSMDLKNRVSE